MAETTCIERRGRRPLDDDELLLLASRQLEEWSAGELPGLTEVQKLFHKLLLHDASSMARDKLIAAIIKKFGKEFGGTKALSSTWTQIAKQVAAERAEAARARQEETPLTDEQKRALRSELWPQAKELATAPDVLDRAVKQVQGLGVVNEPLLIKLVFLTSISRLLNKPLHLLVRGPSSAGKSFVTDTTLRLAHPDAVKHLTTSSPLSLVYDEAPLSHTVLAVFEATQIQQDQNSTFALLVRSLMSNGELIHETTVEDPDAEYGRRTVQDSPRGSPGGDHHDDRRDPRRERHPDDFVLRHQLIGADASGTTGRGRPRGRQCSCRS